MIKNALPVLLFFVVAAPLSGQSERDPKPSDPVSARAQTCSEWTLNFLGNCENPNAGPSGYTAYFEVRSQRPLCFDDGEIVRAYTFTNRSPAKLSVPSRFAAELVAWKNELSRRGPLPPS